MPNGFTGSDEEFLKAELPLKRIDKRLKSFSRKHFMRIVKNYHSWPSRSLEWGMFLRKTIQISLSSLDKYDFWICSAYDKRGRRYWKNGYLKRYVSFDEIENKLEELLEESKFILDSWKKGDLEIVE